MFELHDSAAGLSHRTKIKEVVQSTLTPFYRATEYPFGSMCMHTNIKLQDYLNISFLLKKKQKNKNISYNNSFTTNNYNLTRETIITLENQRTLYLLFNKLRNNILFFPWKWFSKSIYT